MLVVSIGFALHLGQAQQVGARRVDLQRHDLSVTGREVVQTIVELAPGTTAPRHTHPGEEIIYVLEGTWEYTVEGSRGGSVAECFYRYRLRNVTGNQIENKNNGESESPKYGRATWQANT